MKEDSTTSSGDPPGCRTGSWPTLAEEYDGYFSPEFPTNDARLGSFSTFFLFFPFLLLLLPPSCPLSCFAFCFCPGIPLVFLRFSRVLLSSPEFAWLFFGSIGMTSLPSLFLICCFCCCCCYYCFCCYCYYCHCCYSCCYCYCYYCSSLSSLFFFSRHSFPSLHSFFLPSTHLSITFQNLPELSEKSLISPLLSFGTFQNLLEFSIRCHTFFLWILIEITNPKPLSFFFFLFWTGFRFHPPLSPPLRILTSIWLPLGVTLSLL